MDLARPWRWWMSFRDERGRRWSAWRLRGVKALQSRFGRRVSIAMIVFSGLVWAGVFIVGFMFYRSVRAQLTPMEVEMMRAAAREVLHQEGLGLVLGLLANGLALLLVLLMVRATAWRRARYCLGKHVCPVCAYRLEGLRVEEDGCTVCPECGGAWRLNGVVESAGEGAARRAARRWLGSDS